MKRDYHINVFFSAQDRCYVADIPDLRFCSAFGKTPEAAVREVRTAMKAWIDAAKANGKRVPAPRYRPAIYRVAS
jgi:predicted RNase H-like HicB family nuclease